MGGHGHGDHHGPPYEIPDYRIYKVEHPKLVATQRALAQHGLKDPWLRNEAWRFEVKNIGTVQQRAKLFFFRGFKVGAVAFVATIVGTKAYDYAFPSEHHGHDDHH